MNDVPFHQTRMGQIYYEKTLPELVRQIERLNGLLERREQQQGSASR
jgi:hypothetical protein